jgi:iron complex transport system substrate-binding protein
MQIVSLLASATEMIAALGCLDQLVGRSHECDYPPEVQKLPLVSTVQINIDTTSSQIDAQIKQLAQTKQAVQGNAFKALSIYSIDVEQLQKLQPDVIFTQTQCEVCAVSERDVTQALQEVTGLQPRVVSLAPYRLSDVWEDIQRVGQALGRNEKAETLIQGYQQRLVQLRDRTNRLSAGQAKPRITVLEWLDPLMAAGNWTPELVAYAGGENVFGEAGLHSPWLTWEELQAEDPDVIVLSPCGFTLERTMIDLSLLQQQSGWQSLRAVQNKRVYAIDGNAYLNRSGPRLVESAEMLAYSLWGDNLGISIDQQAWCHIT